MANGLYALPPRGIRSMGSPAAYILSKALQTSAVPRAASRDWTAYSCNGGWVCFSGQSRTVQEYTGRGSKVPVYLGFRPADDLSVEPRLDYVVSDSLGGAFPNKVYATLEIRACRVIVVQPLQG